MTYELNNTWFFFIAIVLLYVIQICPSYSEVKTITINGAEDPEKREISYNVTSGIEVKSLNINKQRLT